VLAYLAQDPTYLTFSTAQLHRFHFILSPSELEIASTHCIHMGFILTCTLGLTALVLNKLIAKNSHENTHPIMATSHPSRRGVVELLHGLSSSSTVRVDEPTQAPPKSHQPQEEGLVPGQKRKADEAPPASRPAKRKASSIPHTRTASIEKSPLHARLLECLEINTSVDFHGMAQLISMLYIS
jgi:hypothetical protein